MKKVICFCRVSSNQQDLKAQRETVLDAIKKDGFKSSEIAVVEGKESAIKLGEDERLTLAEMNEVLAKNSSITDIYFFAIDRLARRVSVVLSVVDKMTMKGINLHFLNPYPMQTMRNGKEDSMGKMFLTFLSIGAEMEMKMKVERFKAAKQSMKEHGQIHSGKPYFGYYRDNNGYPQIDPQQSEAVLFIYNKYINDEEATLKSIGRELMAKGIFPQRNHSALINKVKNILCDTVYTKGKDAYKPFVPVELQEKAIEKMKNKYRPKVETKHLTYCKGLLVYQIENEEINMFPDVPMGSYIAKNKENKNISGFSINVADTIIIDAVKQLAPALNCRAIQMDKERYLSEINQKNELITKAEKELTVIMDKKKAAIKKAILADLTEEEIKEIANHFDGLTEPYKKEIANAKSQITTLSMMVDNSDSANELKDVDIDSLDDEAKAEMINHFTGKMIMKKIDKFEYSIGVMPNEKFMMATAIPTYRYTFKGGAKHLYRVFANEEEEITDLIIERFKRLRAHKSKEKKGV